MSHVVAIEMVLTDLAAIKAACKEMGLVFKENQKTFKWWGRWANDYGAADAAYRQGIATKDYGKCEHAIGVPGTSWEIGLVRSEAGYKLAFDFYGSSGLPILNAVGGQNAGKFLQTYGVHKATLEARKRGYTVQRKAAKGGAIQLVVTV
jgi:hypothetical protein